MHLVPIKVKIYLSLDGKHKHPDFNRIESSLRRHMDWSIFWDQYGLAWHYDKLSSYGEVDQGNDPEHLHANHDLTCWYGVTCIPEDFAEAAVEMFPEVVEIISEASFESFYDDRSHCFDETEIIDSYALQKLESRLRLEAMPGVEIVPPSEEILRIRKNMLDPNHPSLGIRKNRKKKWVDFKKMCGAKIRPKEAK